jgi:hypothetical protein
MICEHQTVPITTAERAQPAAELGRDSPGDHERRLVHRMALYAQAASKHAASGRRLRRTIFKHSQTKDVR